MSIVDQALVRTRYLGTTPPVDWSDSKFEDINVGGFGEALVAVWAADEGHIIDHAEDSVFDLRIDGRRTEVKTAKIRPEGRGFEFYNVYPHTADEFMLVAVEPTRVRIYRLSNLGAEVGLGARHKLTLVAAIRAGAELVYDGA
jgi:hypothetical protein